MYVCFLYISLIRSSISLLFQIIEFYILKSVYHLRNKFCSTKPHTYVYKRMWLSVECCFPFTSLKIYLSTTLLFWVYKVHPNIYSYSFFVGLIFVPSPPLDSKMCSVLPCSEKNRVRLKKWKGNWLVISTKISPSFPRSSFIDTKISFRLFFSLL